MILVTGASGFLGKHLVRMLSAQGATARALYNNNAPKGDMATLPGVTWQRYDLLDIYAVEEAMAGIDEIYHCAAVVSFKPADKQRMIHFNVESTANIVNQALSQGIRKMIYVSSVAALGEFGHGKKTITEEEEWQENKMGSSYSVSKYQAEMEVWRGIGEGLTAAIVNPSIIIGSDNTNEAFSGIMEAVAKGLPFYTNGTVGWVDVQDVARSMVMLMESDILAERFIISEGNHSYKEMLAIMARALDKRAPFIHARRWMTGLVWRAAMLIGGAAATITRETMRSAHETNAYDNSKFLRAFPSFQYKPIAASVADMAQSFRSI